MRSLDDIIAHAKGSKAPAKRNLVEQVDELLAEADRHKIADARKQLLFAVDLIDTWLGINGGGK